MSEKRFFYVGAGQTFFGRCERAAAGMQQQARRGLGQRGPQQVLFGELEQYAPRHHIMGNGQSERLEQDHEQVLHATGGNAVGTYVK